MDKKCESDPLISNLNRTSGESSADGRGSLDTIEFDGKMAKSSTQEGDLAETWGGRRSLPDYSGRLRRAHSWSGGPPDDTSSEIRILRERYVLIEFYLILLFTRW